MFTGIIQEIGVVTAIKRSGGIVRLSIYAPKTGVRLKRLESVSVDGVCLSVVSAQKGFLSFEVIAETQRLTTLGSLRVGSRVNIEPSLTLTDRVNGHFVFGHVDGVGKIVRRKQLAGELVLEIRVADRIRRFLVPKGPIALDGISLTLGPKLGRSTFSVHLIPETLRQTTLGERVVGETVNVEIDYFAKLMLQFLRMG